MSTRASVSWLPFLLLIPALSLFRPDAIVAASEIAPLEFEGPGGDTAGAAGRFSDRTLSLIVEVDRDRARVLAFTLKERPFVRPLGIPAPWVAREETGAQIEVVLTGPEGATSTQRFDARSICLAHDGDAEPHIIGDTIRLHRDTFVVEVPEIQGLDVVEVAFYEGDAKAPSRRLLATEALDAAKFTPAGGKSRYEDLAIATPAISSTGPAPLTSGTVIWPEDVGDPDLYTVFGDPAETSKRINVVIVPDGYTVAEKGTMQAHANSLVAAFRDKSPYKEHDRFFNYVLVYAYSAESGTDQCDCSIVRDTAMGTRFPDTGFPCGDSANRCLYYGSGCDTDSSANIALAELRAPAADKTIVMVNTTRYGGCGAGARSVYAASIYNGTRIAIHEFAHSLAGLADEYVVFPKCGGGAFEINTSTNPTVGAWPEWVPEIGAPVEGAQYYALCIYRPIYYCMMRSYGVPFCPVCQQHTSLVVFAHPRVGPTAPIESKSPGAGACLRILAGGQIPFSVGTRLAEGPGVTNSIRWTIQGPGYPSPTTVAVGATSYTHTFLDAGTYVLTCRVEADTNFIKPSKAGANVDVASWTIDVLTLADDPDGDGDVCDCDDTRGSVYHGAPEVCDGLNNDCSDPDWPSLHVESDDDGDGLAECEGDCDDAHDSVYPGAVEICDGFDSDCDGIVPAGEADADADGWRICDGDCDDVHDSVHPGAVEICDGLDNDCQGGVPAGEADADLDGYRVCGGDCDDVHASVHPGGVEICDGFNNDCGHPLWPSLVEEESDDDGDGLSECAGDCDDANPMTWSIPGEASDLVFQSDGQTLVWSPPGAPGCSAPVYDTVRSGSAADFVSGATCVESDDGGDTQAVDTGVPPPGVAYYYLVCAQSACGVGSAGKTSGGSERVIVACP